MTWSDILDCSKTEYKAFDNIWQIAQINKSIKCHMCAQDSTRNKLRHDKRLTILSPTVQHFNFSNKQSIRLNNYFINYYWCSLLFWGLVKYEKLTSCILWYSDNKMFKMHSSSRSIFMNPLTIKWNSTVTYMFFHLVTRNEYISQR